MNVPKGYRLVPFVASMEMKNAGWRECDRQGIDPESIEMQTIWHSMIEGFGGVDLNAYDEAKERELFCFWSSTHEYLGGCTLHTGTDGLFADVDLQCAWESWKACAQSRARSAE